MRPVWKQGELATENEITFEKQATKGGIKALNHLLPKIWFSVSRKLHSAQNAANKASSPPALEFEADAWMDEFLKQLMECELLKSTSVKFYNGPDGLRLKGQLGTPGTLSAYTKIIKLYYDTKPASQPGNSPNGFTQTKSSAKKSRVIELTTSISVSTTRMISRKCHGEKPNLDSGEN